MPDPQTGTGDGGIVTTHVIQLPGMSKGGQVGDAGINMPGATIRVVSRPPLLFIGVELLWTFLQTFFGLLAIDGLGLADLAPPGDAFSHLYNVAGIALAPTSLALLKELYDYLGKIRASRAAGV